MPIIDTAKDIYELVKKGATIDLQQRLMQLREEALALQEDNIQLRQKVQMLEEQLRQRNEPEFDGEIYWFPKDGGKKDGPFCQKCFDAEQKLIRLQSGKGEDWSFDWRCSVCGTNYGEYHQGVSRVPQGLF